MMFTRFNRCASRQSKSQSHRGEPARAAIACAVEPLENRRLLAAVTVGNALDVVNGSTSSIANLIANPGGDGISLREAILAANATAGADTIGFASLFDTPQTINLTSGELALTDSAKTTLTGPGAKRLTVSGEDASRAFFVFGGAAAEISGLTITRGRSGFGGGLENNGTLSLSNAVVRDSHATFGGGIANYGVMSMTNCTVTGNAGGRAFPTAVVDPAEKGGGILNEGSLSMTNCTVTGNIAELGAGLWNESGSPVTIVNCTFSGNEGFGLDVENSGSGITLMSNNIISSFRSFPAILGGQDEEDIPGSNNLMRVDARLGPLADYGGQTPTMMPRFDSPAIDGGTTAGAPTTDQMGYARGASPDIGAVEVNYDLTVTTTHNEPGQAGLAAALNRANLKPGADTIGFSSLFDTPQTILLYGDGPIVITDDVTLAPAAALTIQGNAGSDMFYVKHATASLSNLTLTGGRIALLSLEGTVAMTDCTVSGNALGGVYNGGQDTSVWLLHPSGTHYIHPTYSGGSVELTRCVISNNTGQSAVRNTSGDMTLTDSIVRDNSVNTGFEHTDSGAVRNLGTLTMTGSTISGNSVAGAGGGLWNNGTATLIDSTVSGNTAHSFAGGIANLGSLSMSGVTLADNTVTSQAIAIANPVIVPSLGVFVNVRGGGGLVNAGTALLTDCIIAGNTALPVPPGNPNTGEPIPGGGVRNDGILTMTTCVVNGNTASSNGGGIFNAGKATLAGSNVSGNRTESGNGGGIANVDTLTLTDVTLSGNAAIFMRRFFDQNTQTLGDPFDDSDGGGLSNWGAATLKNVTVSGNSAHYGGGIATAGAGTSTLTNVTVGGNSAEFGGGLANVGSSLDFSTIIFSYRDATGGTSTLMNVTISDNSATTGGGLENRGTMALTNTIVSGNTGGGNVNGVVTGTHNLIGGNALLAPLGDYGGPTWTMPPLAGSPTIDAGDPFFHSANTGILYDQRGEPRVVRGAAQTETNDVVGLAEIKFSTTGGQVVTPVDAFASSYFSGQQLPVNLIDNSGLDTTSGNVLTYTHAPHGSAVGMWAAGNGQGGGNPAPVVDNQYIVLDLGASHNLSQAYLWQMVQTNLIGRGIKEFRLYGSPVAPSPDDAANPPAVYNLTGYNLLLDTTMLAPGPQSGPSTTQAFALSNATNVRTIYIDVISSYNTGPRIDIGAVEATKWFVANTGQFLVDAPSVQFMLSDGVDAASVSPSDVLIEKYSLLEPSGTVVPATGVSVDGAVVTFNLPTNMADASYRATLKVGSVADASGNPLSLPLSFDFFVLAGDANRDRKVDVADLGILASNWQQTGRTFSQADFNYDGVVDVADLGILASSWQNQLATAAAPAATARKPVVAKRIAAVVL